MRVGETVTNFGDCAKCKAPTPDYEHWTKFRHEGFDNCISYICDCGNGMSRSEVTDPKFVQAFEGLAKELKEAE